MVEKSFLHIHSSMVINWKASLSGRENTNKLNSIQAEFRSISVRVSEYANIEMWNVLKPTRQLLNAFPLSFLIFTWQFNLQFSIFDIILHSSLCSKQIWISTDNSVAKRAAAWSSSFHWMIAPSCCESISNFFPYYKTHISPTLGFADQLLFHFNYRSTPPNDTPQKPVAINRSILILICQLPVRRREQREKKNNLICHNNRPTSLIECRW